MHMSASVTSAAASPPLPAAAGPSSFTSTLPSTGLDVLLIGRSDLCRPIAESLLSVTFDRTSLPAAGRLRNRRQRSEGGGGGDVAVEALRRHLRGGGGDRLVDSLKARHVRMVGSLPSPPPPAAAASSSSAESNHGSGNHKAAASKATTTLRQRSNDANRRDGDPRVDHAVIVVSPADPTSAAHLRTNAQRLHPDYAVMNRVTVIVAKSADDGGGDDEDAPSNVGCHDLHRTLECIERGGGAAMGGHDGTRRKRRRRTEEAPLFPAPVPVLRCDLADAHSRLAVARMVLQRAKVGSRGCGGADYDGGGTMVAGGVGGDDDGSSNSSVGVGSSAEVADVAEGIGSGAVAGIGGGGGGGMVSPLFFSSLF